MSESKTVLIIDDKKDLAEPLSTALEYEGFTVITAKDGEEGLKMALEQKPDLILLDLLMPEVGGQEVLKKLRADSWGKDARVIVMTVLNDMENIAGAVEGGSLDYIIKTDISLSGIVEKVKKALNA